ncbi:MAG: hypothetical protein R3F42_05115 [Pseudomonadota bacterium]
MNTLLKVMFGLCFALFSARLLAHIEVSTSAEIEVKEVNAQGEQIVRRVPATTVVPGTEVIYTITAKNTGTEPADRVVVTNRVPEQTVYVAGSAAGPGVAITFSVDGGKTYATATKLSVVDAAGKTRPATAADYTHVRWTFQSSLGPVQEAPVWYRARVK